jgi:hypothetical protein
LATTADAFHAATPKKARFVTVAALPPARVVILVAWLTIWTTWVELTATDGFAGSTHGRDVPQATA